ncbi:hypothetical protein J7382_05735 [Shimia sp. R11_0]|uniref:Uncharacterized protein n=1 Tax=Shimia marina TaxID=321267 RepID=A0A0P1ETL8_9RHOB|nr:MULTISPECIES: hypothetical protein [Shimia]MBO9477028.1 hypothetical protein [Shimia sp. R11_0]CUH53691.1 hypothetical protein SHM7688_03150 [Shimia marina]SFD70868.1 hypothetical protein SAMN04488037_102120 [Shimia marina]
MFQALFATPKAEPQKVSRHARLFELLRQQNLASQSAQARAARAEGDFLADRLLQNATSSLRRNA